ncbi:MAG: AAA family ATPase [Caldilineaceae bacterium]
MIDVQHQGHAAARTRTYALEGRLAYGPVAEWLRTETLRPTLTKLNPVWLKEIARLLPELLAEQPELPAPPPLTARWQQKQLFEALVQAFTAANRPLLLLLDDLQWCDPETLDWLHYLLDAAPQAPILLVGTMRNDEMDDDHPLYKLGHHLRRAGKLTMIDLTPLSAQETAALGAQVAMQGLDADATRWLYQETAGNPLFVVECVRAGLRQGDRETGKQRDGGEGFSLSELPPKVFGVMQARLAQLSSEAHALAQLAATVGRAFTVELLIQAGHQDEATVVRSLDELWRRRLLREQTPGTYDFSHDRLRDVAYTEMSPIRRRLFHQRIAQALEQVYSANLDAVSGQVAAQYELAGALEQAVLYYQQAADAARRIYAKREVAHYLQKALTLLNALPNTPAHLQQELAMQVDLAAVLMSIEGLASPAAEQAYVRAFDLGQQVEMTTHLFPTLWGLHEVYLFQAKAEPARALAAQCMAIAQREQDPALLLQAHHACWSVLLYLSPPDLPLALAHAEAGIALYHPQQHHAHVFHYGGHDPGQCARLIAAEALWLLGYPEQALLRSQEALELGRQLSHPGTLEFALHGLTYIRIHRREIHAIPELTALSIAINLELEIPMGVAVGMIQQGWALVMQGDSDQGLPQIRQGVKDWLALGLVFRQSHHWVLLAEAYARAGQPEAGLAAIEEAQAAADASGERYLEAEMYRLHGELLLATGRAMDEAEGAFQQALTTARPQQAKSLELRASVSLCRLWQQQGRIREARQLLAEIYHWFTEGFDTADLREAKALLDELQCAENVEACLHPSCVEQLAL